MKSRSSGGIDDYSAVYRNLRAVRHQKREIPIDSPRESFAAGLAFVAFAAVLLLLPTILKLLGD